MDIDHSEDLLDGTIAYLFRNNDDIYKNISTKASTNSIQSYCVLNSSKCADSFTTNIGTSSPQWLQVEFKKAIIYVRSYSIRSSNTHYNKEYHIKGWKLIASIDGGKWDVIHEESDYNGLNKYGEIKGRLQNDHFPDM